MIFVIRPLGEGYKARSRWLLQASAYTLGLLTSSALTGTIAGQVGHWLAKRHLQIPLWAVAALALAYALKEFNIILLPTIQRRWQVPITWVQRTPFFGSLLYGLSIGTGFLTYITYPGFYVWIATAVALADPGIGALFGVTYGFGRALPIYLPALAKRDEARDPFMAFGAFVLLRARTWHKVSAGLLLLAATALIGVSL